MAAGPAWPGTDRELAASANADAKAEMKKASKQANDDVSERVATVNRPVIDRGLSRCVRPDSFPAVARNQSESGSL